MVGEHVAGRAARDVALHADAVIRHEPGIAA